MPCVILTQPKSLAANSKQPDFFFCRKQKGRTYGLSYLLYSFERINSKECFTDNLIFTYRAHALKTRVCRIIPIIT